jgi:hypothetical protein
LEHFGIEVAQAGSIPDQPKDPLHYDMKIPPETHSSDDDHDSDGMESDESGKDSKVVRRDDKTHAVRQSGRND